MILNENLEGSQKLGLCEKNLDIAKGIGIVLVIIGHCIPDASTPQEISEPHIPHPAELRCYHPAWRTNRCVGTDRDYLER